MTYLIVPGFPLYNDEFDQNLHCGQSASCIIHYCNALKPEQNGHYFALGNINSFFRWKTVCGRFHFPSMFRRVQLKTILHWLRCWWWLWLWRDCDNNTDYHYDNKNKNTMKTNGCLSLENDRYGSPYHDQWWLWLDNREDEERGRERGGVDSHGSRSSYLIPFAFALGRIWYHVHSYDGISKEPTLLHTFETLQAVHSLSYEKNVKSTDTLGLLNGICMGFFP